MKVLAGIIVAVLFGYGLACGSAPEAPPDPNNAWTVTEIHLLTNDFVRRCAGEADWIAAFVDESRRRPVLRVRGLKNNTREDIDSTPIMDTLTEAFRLNAAVHVAPSNVVADVMLLGDLSVIIEPTANDAGWGMVKRYVGNLAVIELPSGRELCGARGDVAIQIDDVE
ncbi:MAG: hypothetical protein V3T05_10650 [Myxococcota bacterium]